MKKNGRMKEQQKTNKLRKNEQIEPTNKNERQE